jgi:hypothetical protein
MSGVIISWMSDWLSITQAGIPEEAFRELLDKYFTITLSLESGTKQLFWEMRGVQSRVSPPSLPSQPWRNDPTNQERAPLGELPSKLNTFTQFSFLRL